MEPSAKKEDYISFVANYLRKSRGENDSDLDKHRLLLLDMCNKNGWKYVEYPEIETGDSIEIRPVFKQLLKDIQEGLYDAVCVVDIDRLGRGSKGDQDLIENTFKNTGTLIATPTKVYDLSNDDDEFVVDMKGFLARREYKMIVKRLTQGKKVGSRRGDWTNGTPPYPYEYERWKEAYNPKGLVVNKDKNEIYQMMKDLMIRNKMTPDEIAWELNKKKIPSPRGGLWHGNTINRILVDETHLSKVISNKTKGNGHKKKKSNADPVATLPKSEWVTVENRHEAVKTKEEHEKIITILHKRNTNINRVRYGKRPLSNLIKCAKCGHTMHVVFREDRKTPESVKPCWYKDPYGNKCSNSGGVLSEVHNIVQSELRQYEEQLKQKIMSNEGADVQSIQEELQIKLNEINTKEKALERIQEAYEEEAYTIEEFKKRKEKVRVELTKLEEDLSIIQLRLKHTESMTNEDRLSVITSFWEEFTNGNLNPEEQNKLYKTIIDNITWEKTGSEIKVIVNFL